MEKIENHQWKKRNESVQIETTIIYINKRF